VSNQLDKEENKVCPVKYTVTGAIIQE